MVCIHGIVYTKSCIYFLILYGTEQCQAIAHKTDTNPSSAIHSNLECKMENVLDPEIMELY